MIWHNVNIQTIYTSNTYRKPDPVNHSR